MVALGLRHPALVNAQAVRNAMLTKEQLAARQALIDSMAAVSIMRPDMMADMVLDELEDRGFTVKRKSSNN